MIYTVFISDNNYYYYLKVVIASMLENNDSEIKIYVIDNGIKDNNKKNLQTFIKNYSNVNLEFITLSKNINSIKMYREGKTSSAAYSKLFLSSLLPENLNKILYFDCDSLITDSLEELWNINISNYYAAVVLENVPDIIKTKINFRKEDNYFNTGMMLINLKKWRDDQIEKNFVKILEKYKNEFIYYDQGIINIVLKNKIKVIDIKYNLVSQFLNNYNINQIITSQTTQKYYNENMIDYARKNPVFIHFTGHYQRPWLNKETLFRKTYEKYVNIAEIDPNLIFLDNIKLNKPYKISTFLRKHGIIKIIPKVFLRILNNYSEEKAIKYNEEVFNP